jgi:methionyl-tRNA formyltransferase
MAALRLAFAGTPDFAAQHLQALLASRHQVICALTQPDRRSGRGKKTHPSPVKALAEAQGLPVLQPPTLRDEAAVAALRELDIDALVVVAYGLILPQSVLDLPRLGCVNVHGSLLPRWRGAAPIQRAVEAGDKETGITIMRMDAGLDTGPMLARRCCLIPPLATSGDLYLLLAELGPALLREVLDDLPTYLAKAQVQDDAAATYAEKLGKEEARIEWTRPASELARRIRAFNPAPGCFSYLAGERVKIWRAQPLPSTSLGDNDNKTDREPGMINDCSERGITVTCGQGSLLLQTLQFPGAKALSAAELLRGRGGVLHAGAHFGQEP